MTSLTTSSSAAPSFTRMDESTPEQWAAIGQAIDTQQGRVADHVLMLLRQLGDIVDGFAVDQLTHVLQTATRAERAGASEEMILASLCHDIGKVLSTANHPAIAAEIIKPYVSDDVYWLIRVHQDFQGRHYYAYFGADPEARDQYRGHPAFELAEQFADDWDQASFDPAYDALPLEHFEPLLRRLLARPRA
jgi:predicted HD phosphohydrolase